MTVNYGKFCHAYLNKFVVQYNNTYQHSISRNPISTDYFELTEETETNVKAFTLKVNDGVKITKCKNIFEKAYTESWSRKTFIMSFVLKSNALTYKIKDLNFL